VYVYRVHVPIFFSSDVCTITATVEQYINSACESDFSSTDPTADVLQTTWLAPSARAWPAFRSIEILQYKIISTKIILK
jgi:hypothetical protein